MIQCPRCGALLPTGTIQCTDCRVALSPQPAGQSEVSEPLYAQEENWQVFPSASPATSQPNIYGAPVALSPPLYSEPGWFEFGGTQPPVPGNYGTAFHAAGNQYPGFVQPIMPTAKRRRSLPIIMLAVSIVALFLISGSVIVGVFISRQSLNKGVIVVDPMQQLYQQATGKRPTFVDPLNSVAVSDWNIYEDQHWGCSIKSDGLHVHIEERDHFYYCTSGRGKFANFAMQAEMKILSGWGGISFRADVLTGNLYYILFLPDGHYTISIEKNNQFAGDLQKGTASAFTKGVGQVNTITVIAKGSQLYFYVNQKFFFQINDVTYTSGETGLVAYDDIEASEVVYTNAKIWML